MNLSRNEYIIAAGVILTHLLFIALGLVDVTNNKKDSSDVIRAQLIQPPPSVAPQARGVDPRIGDGGPSIGRAILGPKIFVQNAWRGAL